jgi:hypothetical protein
VVFAEDVTDVQSANVVSGESIYFVNTCVLILSLHSSCLEGIVP